MSHRGSPQARVIVGGYLRASAVSLMEPPASVYPDGRAPLRMSRGAALSPDGKVLEISAIKREANIRHYSPVGFTSLK